MVSFFTYHFRKHIIRVQKQILSNEEFHFWDVRRNKIILLQMLGMSEQKKPNFGIKVSQSPGGRSSFQFSWKDPPLAKTINQAKSQDRHRLTTICLGYEPTQPPKPPKAKHPIAQGSITLSWQTKEPLKRAKSFGDFQGVNSKKNLNPESASYYANGKVVERAGSPKPCGVRIRSPPGGISSIKFG